MAEQVLINAPHYYNDIKYALKYLIKENISIENKIPFELSYQLNICLVKKLKTESVIEISFSNYLINGEKPESKINNLAFDCAVGLSPYYFVTDKGEVNIFEHENWIKKFKQFKEHISDKYTGKVAITYLKLMEEMYANEGALLNNFLSNSFFQHFFLKCDWINLKDYIAKVAFWNISLPLNCKLEYKKTKDNELGKHKLLFSATVEDQITKEEFFKNMIFEHNTDQYITGNAEIIQYIDQKTLLMDTVEAIYELYEDEELFLKKKITINMI